jgi:hypothetical protein
MIQRLDGDIVVPLFCSTQFAITTVLAENANEQICTSRFDADGRAAMLPAR